MIFGILENNSAVKLIICAPIQEPSNNIIIAAATILGIKVNVISCICVADWNIAITSPTSRLERSSGPATFAITHNILVPI